MKRSLALIAAALFTAGTAGAVFAQTQTPPAAPKADDKAADKKMDDKKATEKKPSPKSTSGTVKSATADSLVVTGKDKGKDAEWTFALDAKTKITKSGKAVTAADVKAGDSVQVRYMEEGGKSTAQAVTIRPQTTAKKTDAKPAEAKPAETKPAEKKP